LVRDDFEFDGRQTIQGSLLASAVVGLLDPGHDRDAQLLTGALGAAVEDVLLQQAEEAFPGGVVATGGDLTHRSDQAMVGQGRQEVPAAKLRPAVRVRHTVGDIAVHRNGILERTNGETRLHPGADQAPEDLVPEHVLDHAERTFPPPFGVR